MQKKVKFTSNSALRSYSNFSLERPQLISRHELKSCLVKNKSNRSHQVMLHGSATKPSKKKVSFSSHSSDSDGKTMSMDSG